MWQIFVHAGIYDCFSNFYPHWEVLPFPATPRLYAMNSGTIPSFLGQLQIQSLILFSFYTKIVTEWHSNTTELTLSIIYNRSILQILLFIIPVCINMCHLSAEDFCRQVVRGNCRNAYVFQGFTVTSGGKKTGADVADVCARWYSYCSGGTQENNFF